MSILASLATVSGIFLGLGAVPQAIKIFKRKSAQDIAPSTYWIAEVGSVIWILYGIELHNLPIIIPNILGFLTSTVILIGWFLYGKSKNT